MTALRCLTELTSISLFLAALLVWAAILTGAV